MRNHYRIHLSPAEIVDALQQRLRRVEDALASGEVDDLVSSTLPEHLRRLALEDQRRLIRAELRDLRAGKAPDSEP